jgi:hypothetical protein
MTLMVGGLIFHQVISKKAVPIGSFLVLILVLFFVLFSYLINLPDSSLIIFFPVIGIAFLVLSGQEARLLEILYLGLFIHIVVGIGYVISSYLLGMNLHVHPMYDKGLPFLHAAKGLTTTVQTYGTLLIGWFLIYYYRKEQGLTVFWDRWAFRIALLGLLLTFNRNSFLIFYIILFFKHRRIFFLSLMIALGAYLYFFEFVNKLIFNVSTLSSRSDLLQAFRISFFEQTDWIGYLIGHGNNIVGDSVARGTVYATGYIENGTSVLLYTYGFVGYLAYLISIFAFSILFFRKGKVFYAAIFFYIFIIAQQFTHEFYSTTIYLLLAVFLLLFNRYPSRAPKADFLSSAE